MTPAYRGTSPRGAASPPVPDVRYGSGCIALLKQEPVRDKVPSVAIRTSLRPDPGIAAADLDTSVPDTAQAPAPAAPAELPPAAPAGWRAGASTRGQKLPDLPRSSLETARRLSALPPSERAQQVQQLETKRDALRTRIQERVGVLDDKWRQMPPGNREACLRDYAARSKNLSPEQKAAVMQHVEAAKAARQRAGQLQQKVESLKAQHAEPAAIAQAEKAAQAATAQQTQAVDAAGKVVDDAGLKLDLLMLSEPAIDPGGMSLGSLFDMFDEFFDVTLSLFTAQIDDMQNDVKESQKDDKRVEDDLLKHDLEDRWRQGDGLKRRLLTELGDRSEDRRLERAARGAQGPKS